MRMAVLGLLLLTLTAVGAGAAPFGRACCDVFIYEPARGALIKSYAVRSRSTGAAGVVEVTAGAPSRLVEGDAARALVERWLNDAREGRISRITVKGAGSEVRLGGDDDDLKDEDEEVTEDDGATDTRGYLVYVSGYSAAKTVRLIDEIPGLPADANARMKAIVAAR